MNNLKTNLYNPRVNFPDKLKEVILPEKQQIAILESMVRASLLCVHVERNKTAQEKAKFAQTCFLKLIKKARDRHGTSLINHLEIHAGFDSKVVECTLSETSFLKRNEFKKSLQTPERLDAYRLHQKQSLLVFDVELQW